MRRMILTSLVLIPVLANAQTSAPTGPQPSSSSAILEAELTTPSAPAAAPITSISAANVASHAVVREVVHTSVSDDFLEAAMRKGGTIEHTLYGSSSVRDNAPQLTRAVEIELTQEELATRPAVSNVVVRATVDQYGYPRNLQVAQSAGSLVDKRALEAVSQYRFKPATRDNQPVEANVSITIKIEKP